MINHIPRPNVPEPGEKRDCINDPRVLTGKYNLAHLKEISRIEEMLVNDLIKLYGVVDEDHLPVELDLHEYIEMPASERSLALKNLLKDCPSTVGITAFIERACDSLKSLSSSSLGVQ